MASKFAAKQAKLDKQLQQAKEVKEAAHLLRLKSVDGGGQPKKRVQHCTRCHEPLATTYRVVGVNGKEKHDCEAAKIPPCTDLSRCRYNAGHAKEVAAEKKIAKLQAKQQTLAAEAEREVCVMCVSCQLKL